MCDCNCPEQVRELNHAIERLTAQIRQGHIDIKVDGKTLVRVIERGTSRRRTEALMDGDDVHGADMLAALRELHAAGEAATEASRRLAEAMRNLPKNIRTELKD